MPITIVDADMKSLRKAAARTRQRSPDTLQLIAAIESFEPGRAKQVQLETGETAQKVRAKLNYAATIADRRVSVVTGEDGVLFALRGGGPTESSREGAANRREAVRRQALELAEGDADVKAEQVVAGLADEGVTLDVSRPATAVGAVLRATGEFVRTGRNAFRRTPR